MAKEKFYFLFSEEPNKKIYIDEPEGWSSVDHNLNQKENGHGRDESLSGGEFPFTFNDQQNHKLEIILYYLHRYKSKALVIMGVELEDGTSSVQQIHFPSAVTDDLTYFKCKMIVKSSLQVVKRQSKTMVDVFSDKTIKNEYIEPIKVSNMLLQSKPDLQISEWVQPGKIMTHDSLLINSNFTYLINRSEILNTYTFYKNYPEVNGRDQAKNNFVIIEAQTSLKNFVLEYSGDLIFYYLPTGHIYEVSLLMFTFTGTYEFPELFSQQILHYKKFQGSNAQTFNFSEYVKSTPIDLNRGENVSYHWRIDELTNNPAPPVENRSYMTFENTKAVASSSSTDYNSITPAIRLIDAIKQVTKSISGLNVFAPKYDVGGVFYDTFLTNGKLLAGIKDKPFYLSLDFLIDKCIRPEQNADSEIDINENLFVGTENDYYKDIECAIFNDVQFDEMTKELDPIFCINEFKMTYSKYQSLKENTVDNSANTIHGESFWTPDNDEVDNKKECKIEWVRDAILLDVQQRLSTKITSDTATQEDDTVFAIDAIETEGDKSFTETTNLQHYYDGTYLFLRSGGTVNFSVLGIKENTVFNIAYPDKNSGNYNVFSVGSSEIQLLKTSGGAISTANDGQRLTKYTYQVKKETIPITNRTNEGFTYIENLISPEKYSNLRYSNKRNIINWWEAYLATVNLSSKESVIKNTLYRNNGDCVTQYQGLRIKENEDFLPKNPLMTPFIYKNMVVANMDYIDYKKLELEIRSKRGYIRTTDNKGIPLKLFHRNMTFIAEERKMIFTGAQKYENSWMTIVSEENNILINNETRLVRLKYEILDKYQVAIYDKQRQRLYDPVYWDMISINGKMPKTINELENWLKILE